MISQLYEVAVQESFFRAPINRSLPNSDVALRVYLEKLAVEFTKLLKEDTFIESIRKQLKQYPYRHYQIKLPRK